MGYLRIGIITAIVGSGLLFPATDAEAYNREPVGGLVITRSVTIDIDRAVDAGYDSCFYTSPSSTVVALAFLDTPNSPFTAWQPLEAQTSFTANCDQLTPWYQEGYSWDCSDWDIDAVYVQCAETENAEGTWSAFLLETDTFTWQWDGDPDVQGAAGLIRRMVNHMWDQTAILGMLSGALVGILILRILMRITGFNFRDKGPGYRGTWNR